MQHHLRTRRLDLRPVTRLDLTALVAHWTDPDVRRFLFDGAIVPEEEVLQAITDSDQTFASADWGLWGIRDGRGELIGTVGLRPLDGLGPEIMYSLTPSAWRQGYASEAAAAVVDYALGVLGLPEVLAEVDEGNAASVAIVRRLGMTAYEMVPGVLGPMVRYRLAR